MTPEAAMDVAVILGQLFVLVGKLARHSFDPLFLGLAAALFCILPGMIFNSRRRHMEKI